MFQPLSVRPVNILLEEWGKLCGKRDTLNSEDRGAEMNPNTSAKEP